MRTVLLMAAGGVLLLVGAIHSVLGERLIFRRLRDGGVIPTAGAPPLQARHVRILWATWHIVTLFGVACAAMLFRNAAPSTNDATQAFVEQAIAMAAAASALLVLVATRGRHPGWIGLLVVAVLVWLASTPVT